jgi:hypothetical protein
VVTADAVSCQTEIVKKIREKEADYIYAYGDERIRRRCRGISKSTLKGWRAGRYRKYSKIYGRGGRKGARAC